MGQQSSRIIWGKSKNPGGNDPGPVGLYQENSYIYCSGNYAIHSTGQGRVAEDYHLYLCTATETGGTWNSEDWKLINGVKNYYLIAHKSFKKGAKVIKEDHNGDFETLKLYSCIVEKTTPNRWIDDEWEVVYQEVGIAWIPRDHKDVYYDDGRNRNKWHKLMWFVPDYYEDQKLDEEIGEFSELQTYHYGERAIHRTLIGEVYCYTYDSNIPRRSEWAAGWWSKDEGVEMYETYKTYYKGDEVIKKNIEAGYQVIQEYQDEMYFEQGKFTLNIIDKEYDVTALAGFHDIVYLERIFGGESIYGLYKSNKTTSGVFNQPDWDLQTSQVIQTRGRDHNMVPIHTDEDTGIICRYCGRFITGYKQKDIKEYQYGAGYEEGELVIWTFDDDIFGLLECQKEIPTVLVPSEYSSDWMPPNEEYWTPIDQFVEQANTLRVFKATKAMDASINTHFIRENWAIVSQKMEPDYDLYGVIWEKYGKPGGGGGIPFFIFIPIQDDYYGGRYINGWVGSTVRLYPFMGNNVLEKDLETSCYWTEGWSGDICVTDLYYTNNKVYGFMGNMSNNYYFYFFMLGKWYKNHLMELINYGNLRTTDNHILYFYPTGSYTSWSSDYRTKGKLQKIIPSLYDNSDATIIDLYTTPENMSTIGGYYPEYEVYYTRLSKPFYKYEEVPSAYPYDWWVMQPSSLSADRPSVKITAADILDDGSIVDRSYSRLSVGGEYLSNYYGQAVGYVAGFGFYDKWVDSPYNSLMVEELTAAGLTLVRATSRYSTLAVTAIEIQQVEAAAAKARSYGYEATVDYETFEPYVGLEIKVPVWAIVNEYGTNVYSYASETVAAGVYKEGNTTYRIYCRRLHVSDYDDSVIKKYVVKYAITNGGEMTINSVSTDSLLYDILYNIYGNGSSGNYDDGYLVYYPSTYKYTAVLYKNVEYVGNIRYADYDTFEVNLKTLSYTQIPNIKLYWEIKYYGNPSKFTIANTEYKKVIVLLGYPYIRPKAMKDMDLEDTYIHAAYYITPVKAVSNGGGISTLGYVYWNDGSYDVTCVLFHNFPLGTYVDGFVFKNKHGNYNNDGPIYGGPGYNGFSGW